MKTKLFALAAVASTALFTTTPVIADAQLAQTICAYVAADNRNQLRKTLSDNRLRLSSVYDGIVCDGLPLVRFAIQNKASDTAEFIIKQLPGSQVASSGDVDWANSNGFSDSPVIETLIARAGG